MEDTLFTFTGLGLFWVMAGAFTLGWLFSWTASAYQELP